jgi:hypothetical protein
VGIERVTVFKDRVEIRKTDAGTAEDEADTGQQTVIIPARLAVRNRARILDDGAAA